MGNYSVTYNQPDKLFLDRETKEVQRWKLYANRNYMANLVLIYIITSQILSMTDSQHPVTFQKLWTVTRQKKNTENNDFTDATSRTNPKHFFCTTQDWIKLLTLKPLATWPPHNHHMHAWWWTQIEEKTEQWISQTKTKSSRWINQGSTCCANCKVFYWFRA